ncbi:MAG: ribbon-helix-helix domain-containing protein [Verrucomicrobiota bacterium]|nr:ribbon-helix-helix domain-containing protein [Verrucomicrobiota bacterium]
METLSVKIPEPLAKWLRTESKQTRRSRSAIVREALEFKRNGHRGQKPMTMAEALADLKGTISGPPDLSTNPKYFDGYGQ